jgi:H+-translocating NAD(P) transhydrogenase subunit alpha
MMTTAAGTILPAKVFIIGVGVAGLQAIATAKRLGAKVTAYDTRPVVEEQVKSLGAQFLKIDVGETGQTKDGYAKALTEEQIQKQRDAMKKPAAIPMSSSPRRRCLAGARRRFWSRPTCSTR